MLISLGVLIRTKKLRPQPLSLSPVSMSGNHRQLRFHRHLPIKELVQESDHHIRVLDNLSVGTEKDMATVCDFSVIRLILHHYLFLSPHASHAQLIVGDIKALEIYIN